MGERMKKAKKLSKKQVAVVSSYLYQWKSQAAAFGVTIEWVVAAANMDSKKNLLVHLRYRCDSVLYPGRFEDGHHTAILPPHVTSGDPLLGYPCEEDA